MGRVPCTPAPNNRALAGLVSAVGVRVGLIHVGHVLSRPPHDSSCVRRLGLGTSVILVTRWIVRRACLTGSWPRGCDSCVALPTRMVRPQVPGPQVPRPPWCSPGRQIDQIFLFPFFLHSLDMKILATPK